jgi:hypothetical protein
MSQSPSNRQLFNERLHKYRLTARFHFKGSGPAHAQKWKCFYHVGSYLTGQSDEHSTKDAAKEEAAGRSLAWFDLYGYS